MRVLGMAALAAMTIAAPAAAQQEQVMKMFPVMAKDREDREIMLLISQPRADRERPYRALVAWQGNPHQYWTLTFAFDCGARKSTRMGASIWAWDGNSLGKGFPLGDMYRGYIDWVMAPVICEGDGYTLIRSWEAGTRALRDFADQYR